MPLRTQTYDLDEEVQRLEDRIGELDDILEQIDDNSAAAQFRAERTGLESALEGVRWARDHAFDADWTPQWDADVDEVTLAGLTAGDTAEIEDGLNGGGSGAARIYQVAKGTVEAPYIDDGMGEDKRIGAVSQLPDSYVRWAEARINELSGVGGNAERSYSELYQEMQAANSTQE